jgi:type VI secretion system protein VasD
MTATAGDGWDGHSAARGILLPGRPAHDDSSRRDVKLHNGGIKAMRGIKAGLLALASLACWALVGCGGAAPPPPPTIAALTMKAAADINPDAGGSAAPVTVRVYQLASTTAFDQADFFQLYNNDQAVLGADMLGRDELTLTPGGTQQLVKELKPGVTAIGVVAAFRDIQHANWRATTVPPANKTTAIAVTIQGLNVTVSAAPGS